MIELNTEQLQRIANMLVQAYGHEIARDGDWWFGIDDYDFNIHDCGDNAGTGYYSVNVYEHNGQGMDNYSHWVDLKPVYIGQ